MPAGQARHSREEFASRGQTIYDRNVRPHLRPEDEDKFVAIDIDSGSYEMDRDDYAATERLRVRHPDAQIWLVRVGQPATYRIGGRLAGGATVVFLTGLFLLAIGCGGPVSRADKDGGSESRNDGQVNDPESTKPAALTTAMEILEWLPADTETFVVSNGPFEIQREEEDSRKPLSLARLLEGYSYAPLLSAREGAFIKELAQQEVALAVEGARHFRHPRELGMDRYEGCHILVFRHDLGAAGDALKKALAAAAAKTQKIAGHEVFSLEQKLEKDVWTFFFVQPKSNILVCATDQAYLEEVLGRMERPEAKRALAKDLAEWKHVDRNARFWAVRHLNRDGELDSHSPLDRDPQLVGLVFTYDPGEGLKAKPSPKVKYLSGETDLKKVEKVWTYVGEATLTPKVEQVAPGVIEITANLERVEDGGRFFFVLLYYLGHGISV